jgi:Sec-independent protein secretion pathway component TatC
MSDDASPAAEPRSAGKRLLRILVAVVVIAVVIVVLFTTVFPWVEERTQVPTIGAALTAPPTVTSVLTTG